VARFYESQQNARNLNISVSRGSAVTYLRCGGQCYIYIYIYVENLAGFPVVKEFWKSVRIWRNYRHKKVARFWNTV